MSFEWPRIHKWEDNIESQVTDAVYSYVCEFYGVEEIKELTEDQVNEVMAFRDEFNEYSPMQWGFSNLYNQWESETWEEDE
jgi:hypothetical protein